MICHILQTMLAKGHEYERFVKQTLSQTKDNVWLWHEVPQRTLYEAGIIKTFSTSDLNNLVDIGIDIVVKHEGTFTFVQCKHYDDNSYITIPDLSGFFNFIAENGGQRVVYYTGKLSQQIVMRMNRIQYIHLPYSPISPTLTSQLSLSPRDYQLEATNALKNANRGVLQLPCGMGKTYISMLLSGSYDNIIMLSPLRLLAEQLLSEYRKHMGNSYKYHLVSMDGSRDIGKLVLGSKNVLSATYMSCDVLIDILPKLENLIVVVDECHNLPKNKYTEQLLTSSVRILFLSATPIITPDMRVDCHYSYPWKLAIEKGFICPFEVFTPDTMNMEKHILSFMPPNIEVTKMVFKAYFLLKGMIYYGHKKCIIYLRSIDECHDMCHVLEFLNAYLRLDLRVYKIHADLAKGKRKEFMNAFSGDDDKVNTINIMCSVHILDEGIDIASCDSVFLTNPNYDPINTIQRISRCNRINISKPKKIAGVYIWTRAPNKRQKITTLFSKYDVTSFAKENVIDVFTHDQPQQKAYIQDKRYVPDSSTTEVTECIDVQAVMSPDTKQNIEEKAMLVKKGAHYECAKCNNKFKRKSHLVAHLKRKKPCIKPENIVYTCPTCDKVFKQKRYLSDHMKRHENKPDDHETVNGTSDSVAIGAPDLERDMRALLKLNESMQLQINDLRKRLKQVK